jgi:hypothetical protein
MPGAIVAVNADVAGALIVLRNGQQKIPWAIALSLNSSAEVAQAAIRARVRRVFRVRKDFTLQQTAIIKPRASAVQGTSSVTISVGNKSRFLLGQYEEGADRGPFTPGARNVAIPVVGGARPTFDVPVTPSLQYTALHFRRVGGGSGGRRKGPGGGAQSQVRRQGLVRPMSGVKKRSGGKPIEGAMGTFVVPEVGVFQRLAGQMDKMIYAFKRSVRLNPRLQFVPTTVDAFRRFFPGALAQRVNESFVHQWGIGFPV